MPHFYAQTQTTFSFGSCAKMNLAIVHRHGKNCLTFQAVWQKPDTNPPFEKRFRAGLQLRFNSALGSHKRHVYAFIEALIASTLQPPACQGLASVRSTHFCSRLGLLLAGCCSCGTVQLLQEPLHTRKHQAPALPQLTACPSGLNTTGHWAQEACTPPRWQQTFSPGLISCSP